ncbi:MAG: hypothetical protein EBR82_60015 [Caulobacteraceae bacterium]|nr:hypothetical protein [Caulobacteraceae bacterium]
MKITKNAAIKPKKYTYIVVSGGVIRAKVNTKTMADRIALQQPGTVTTHRVDRLFSRSGKVLNQTCFRAACIEAVNIWIRTNAAANRDVLMS